MDSFPASHISGSTQRPSLPAVQFTGRGNTKRSLPDPTNDEERQPGYIKTGQSFQDMSDEPSSSNSATSSFLYHQPSHFHQFSPGILSRGTITPPDCEITLQTSTLEAVPNHWQPDTLTPPLSCSGEEECNSFPNFCQAQSVPSRNSLLGLPREIRNIIYSYILQIDQRLDCIELPRKGKNESTIFSISHQLRAEAYDFYKNSNLWISLEIRGQFENHTPEDVQKRLLSALSPCIPPCRLDSSFVNTIHLTMEGNQTCSKDKMRRVVFPYIRVPYECLVGMIGVWSPHIKFLEILQTAKTLPPLTVQKLLHPFSRLRNLIKVNVQLPQLSDNGQRLAQSMMISTDNGLIAERYLSDLKEEANSSFREGRTHEAYLLFRLAQSNWCIAARMLQDANVFSHSPQSNMVKSIATDIRINFCLCLNKIIFDIPRDRRLSIRPNLERDLEGSIAIAQCAFEAFYGMLDCQRTRLHFQRGRSCELLAEHMVLTKQPKRAKRYFREAGKDYFFAHILNRDDETIGNSLARIERILKTKMTPEAVRLVTVKDHTTGQIVWQGDPHLYMIWGGQDFINHMDMYQRRPEMTTTTQQ